jgi:hypothetical protein
MSNAVRAWMINLNDYPGWREWKRRKIVKALSSDDPFPSTEELGDFIFSEEVEAEHAIVLQYLGLEESVGLIKECEYYFRRYPFRGLPVTPNSHMTNVCEMYFNRFYEFRERAKKFFKAVGAVAPLANLKTGAFIKAFDKQFDQELRARNSIHHHCRFEDIAIDRIFLTGLIAKKLERKGLEHEHLAVYRKASREWVKRVRQQGAKMDEILEAIAAVTLANCSFLSAKLRSSQRPPPLGNSPTKS